MKKAVVFASLFCFLCIFLLSSCGLSKGEIERGIKQSFQEELDSTYEKYGMKVQDVSLVKSGSNTYNGFVTVLLDDEKHDISITVTADRSSYMYETKPLAFSFLIGYELKSLFW
jgi:hypothetical protein